jgi:methyl coenzyme M reductase gamma subunit
MTRPGYTKLDEALEEMDKQRLRAEKAEEDLRSAQDALAMYSEPSTGGSWEAKYLAMLETRRVEVNAARQASKMREELLEEIDKTLTEAGVWVGGRLDSIKQLIELAKRQDKK